MSAVLCNSSPQSFWENPAWTQFCCSDRWIFWEAAEKQSNVTAKQWQSFNRRVTRAFILWKLQTGRLTAGNIDKAAREIASVWASSTLGFWHPKCHRISYADICVAFPTQRVTKKRLKSLPAVKPVLTNIAFYHKPAHIVRLPADAVQLGRRHLRTVPKQRSQAGIELGGDSFNYAQTTPRGEGGAPRACRGVMHQHCARRTPSHFVIT